MLALVGVLGALLPVLAVLQYRWIGTLSDAEAARMQRSLRTGVARFVEDVYRPLDRMHAAFLLGDPPGDAPLADVLTRRLRRWKATASHPDLLDAVYWVDADMRLVRLDADTGTLLPEPWPDAFRPWRAHAIQLASRSDTSYVPAPTNPPALLLPFASPRPDLHGRFLLLTLNAAYVHHTLFPTLARTHFLDNVPSDFDVVIVDRADSTHVVFRSAPGLNAAALAPPDAAADLGLRSRVKVTAQTDGPGTYVAVLREDSMVVSRSVEISSTETEDVILDARRGDAEYLPEDTGRPFEDPDGFITAGPFTPWRLLVQHRAGSIEAAVAGWRTRNLAVSFGILLLLGGAAGLLVASSRRARRLAEQQIAFVAGVTHELRTPLAVIRSAAENLADGVVTDPDQAKRYGTLIHTEGRRLSELVEQALALAGARSNHAVPDRRPIDVANLVEAALARCRPTLDEATVTTTIDVPADLPSLYGDAYALEGALCNLITNAAKYGGPARWVGIEARLLENGRAPTLALTVRDRGPGIPPHERAQIFEPFFRGEEARAAQIRGSGLGLSLVKHTAEAHGGHVAVESTEGDGAAFMIYLPVHDLPGHPPA